MATAQLYAPWLLHRSRIAWQSRNPNSMGLGQDSRSAAHFRTINTILVLQTPALILINLSSLAGLAAL